jgi:hypothetical protein
MIFTNHILGRIGKDIGKRIFRRIFFIRRESLPRHTPDIFCLAKL